MARKPSGRGSTVTPSGNDGIVRRPNSPIGVKGKSISINSFSTKTTKDALTPPAVSTNPDTPTPSKK